MGGYSSTPRKGKVSEEGGDDTLYYAATGMQVSPLVKVKNNKTPGAGDATSLSFLKVWWMHLSRRRNSVWGAHSAEAQILLWAVDSKQRPAKKVLVRVGSSSPTQKDYMISSQNVPLLGRLFFCGRARICPQGSRKRPTPTRLCPQFGNQHPPVLVHFEANSIALGTQFLTNGGSLAAAKVGSKFSLSNTAEEEIKTAQAGSPA